MKKQIQHYLLLLLLLLPLGIQAQKQFPIYVTPTLTPPYSLNLSEYANFGSQKLMVIMQVNDLDIQNYPVKLHIKLETAGVTIESSPTIATTPIYLDGGATTMLFGEDLADYFNIDNLTFKGCSKQDYLRTGQLPEGFYRITVEALHYTKMVPISNAGIASAWMVVGKPPVLRKPRNAAELGQLPGSALTFSWLSSNVGNPTAAGNIQYTFEMWELRIPGINPNSVTVMAPFYEETTYATMLPVYPAILSLEPGMDYAWRVTASDASGMVPFEQEGHSELRTFTYSSRCDAASSLTAKKIGRSGTFRWDSEPNHTSYNVEMKNPNTGWSHEGVTYQEKAEFHDLTPGSIYELRVQSVCNSDPNSTSDFTDWVTLTIPESKPLYDSVSCPNCGCGDVTDAPELTNFTLRDDLQPGDTIINQRGTTRFIIKSVDNEGGTTYTGEFLFWAEIWGLKFICEYWDLQVNTDNVIVGMDFESVYDPQFLLDVDAAVDAVDELLGAVDVLTDSDIKDTLTYDGEMTSVYVDKAGNVMAVSEDFPAGQIIAKASDNENTLITNADGEAFVVSRDGEVMGVAEYQASGGGKSSKIKANNAEKEKDLSSQTVTFSASAGQKYGFDSYNDSKRNIQQQYLPLQNDYRPAYKSIASYSTDVVTASIYDDIIFKDEMGIPPMQSSNGLTIRGGADGAEVALYAYVDSTQVAGKLKIKSYDQDDNKVHIVSINGAELPSQGDLTKELNRIYGQAVVTWQVETITLDDKVKYDDDVFNHGGTSDLVVYNKDQKAVVTAFKDAGYTIDQDAYYLFFIKDVEDKGRNIGGYMPPSYHVGFIYNKPNNRTIAHELGHGAFSLWHTFSDKQFVADQGKTENLMDYNLENPTELWSYQWDAVHDPAGMALGFLQDEKEGEMVIENSTRALARLIKTINCAHNSGKKEVKLYLPFSTITGSVSGLVSELYLAGNPCAEDAEVKATLYEMFGEVVDLSDDYLEDIFSLENVGYDESTKIITLTGSKYKLLVTGEKDDLDAYNFAKNNLFGSLHVPRTPINFASLEDLQYSSPCELEHLSIDSRKDLLQKIQSETNWYNGSLKDSRQKITINIIATTHEDDKGDLLSFLDANKGLLKNLYDRIDDYRVEFVEEVNTLYQNGKGTLNTSTVVALGIRPGVTIEDKPWYQDFNFLWRKLNLKREHISAEYISSEQVSVIFKEYNGPSGGLPSLFSEGEELCKGAPFDIIQGIDQQSGKTIDVPLICFLHESEETDREVMYNDALTAGKLGVDAALIYFSVRNLQGASAILKSEVTAQNVARLILGFGDVATLGLGKVCENDNSEFCQAYRDYESYINMGLLSANILNEFPQIFKNLKKGLDDPSLTSQQKDGLRKVLGVSGDEVFESARQFVRNNYSQKFLNQITLKYGKENTGALAVLVKRFGDEGADLLRQGKSLDEIASALVKDRVLYRHIGSEAGYLKELKKTGEIPAGYTTYFSADKFDDPVEAISKMQLNSEWTDAVWVAEFEGTQLVGKVQIPNAKWNDADYLEVLTKSFPKWGDGGASQFITKSSIKIKRLRNLETGDIIDF